MTSQKVSQNLKNATPERPKLDFDVIFGFLLALFLHDLFVLFLNGAISRKRIKTNGFSMILRPQAFYFGIRIRSKIHVIFDIAFLYHFFRLVGELGA